MRIKEPIHTILHTSLLAPLKFTPAHLPNTFLKAPNVTFVLRGSTYPRACGCLPLAPGVLYGGDFFAALLSVIPAR